MICEWFNSSTLKLQNYIPSHNDYKITEINKNYTNILSSVKTYNPSALNNKSNFQFNLFNNDVLDNGELICSHKYQINFSDEQHLILESYFRECAGLYNLCVDIWKEYPNVSSCWQLVKDIIFKHLYRSNDNNDIDTIKQLIITDLKKLKNEYDADTEKNKVFISKLKEEYKKIYIEESIKYKEALKINKKAVIKVKLVKPKMKKVKIEKIKKPAKPRGVVIKKPAPDETLKAEIRDFCKNLSNAREQLYEKSLKNKNKIYTFELKYKNTDTCQTISVSKRSITENGLFIQALGDLNCDAYKYIVGEYSLDKECKLQYDKVLNRYYLYVVFEGTEVKIDGREEVVACDPGEKTFITYYSIKEYGNIGDNMRVRILALQRQIRKYQSIIKKKVNRKGKRIKNKKRLLNNKRKLELKIKGYVNEIHKKGAKYLCENYKNILLPTFETKPMISKNKIKLENEKIKKIENKEEAKVELKKLNKTLKMSKNVKYVLSQQSHYKFKRYLKATAKKYGTVVHDVDESYTSQACTNCGILSKDYNKKRIKSCTCGTKIDRDVNGSRNILLKCVCSMPGMKARLASL